MSDKLLEIVLKFLPFIIPVLKSLTQKKKLYELNILFIDDEHEDLAIIKTLRDNKEFWTVSSIWDLDNLENLYLKEADIIFLDTLWIWGKMWVKNWTLLVTSIKNKYPKKLVTIYSSKPLSKDTHLMVWVSQIPKNSSYDIFRSHIQTVWQEKK